MCIRDSVAFSGVAFSGVAFSCVVVVTVGGVAAVVEGDSSTWVEATAGTSPPDCAVELTSSLDAQEEITKAAVIANAVFNMRRRSTGSSTSLRSHFGSTRFAKVRIEAEEWGDVTLAQCPKRWN